MTCAIEGTSVYNNSCGSQVIIQTPSAELVLEGTWLAVTYLPGRQLTTGAQWGSQKDKIGLLATVHSSAGLPGPWAGSVQNLNVPPSPFWKSQVTLIMVFEGRAKVWPVQNSNTRMLGEAVGVEEGHFWFTTPGVKADPIAGLAAREPHPFDRLWPLLEGLNLWPWTYRIGVRAEADRVPMPDLGPMPAVFSTPTPTPSLVPPLCRVVARALNLRHGPGVVYNPPIVALANGTQLDPLARSPDGRWIQVQVQESGQVGWVAAGGAYRLCNVSVANLPVSQPPPAPLFHPRTCNRCRS